MPETRALTKVVIDTNLIIAGRWKRRSASNKIIDLCIEQKLLAVYSGRTKNENIFILEKVRPPAEYLHKIIRFYSRAIHVPRPETRIDVCSDKSDNIYFEAALAGGAKYIISNDHHLLEHDGYMGIRVMRPREFLKHMKDDKPEDKEEETEQAEYDWF